MSAADETVIHIRHITSTKTTSDTKKGNIDDLHFLIVVVFHQDRNQHKEPAGSAPWLNQTSQFILVILYPPNAKLNCFPAFFDQCIQTSCCNIVGSLKNPDRWRAKIGPPRLPPFILFSLHHWVQPDLLFCAQTLIRTHIWKEHQLGSACIFYYYCVSRLNLSGCRPILFGPQGK